MNPDFVAGDTGSKLVVPCFDRDTRAPISLDGKIATLRFWYKEDEAPEIRVMVHQDAPNTHKAEYLFLAEELKPGSLKCEVEITSGDGTMVSQLEVLTLLVREKAFAVVIP